MLLEKLGTLKKTMFGIEFVGEYSSTSIIGRINYTGDITPMTWFRCTLYFSNAVPNIGMELTP